MSRSPGDNGGKLPPDKPDYDLSFSFGYGFGYGLSATSDIEVVQEVGTTIHQRTGLSASATVGTPISAKYEVENGKLQLSVYTKEGSGFSEVVVDHTTGKVAKTEAITSGDDLMAAKAQSEAMVKAKRSLRTAADQAAKENKGYRVVSVMPGLEDGHPVAEVILVKGHEFKTVSEKLD